MVGESETNNPTSNDPVSSLPTADEDGPDEVQGRTSGIIVPPPAIREIAELAAGFVARKGNKFKESMWKKKRNDPNFVFLDPTSPYHTYFLNRVDELAVKLHEDSKKGTTIDSKPANETEQQQQSKTDEHTKASEELKPNDESKQAEITTVSKTAAVSSALVEALKNKPKEAPPKFKYLVEHPVYVTPKVAETIRLTAQYTAVKGHSFINEVARRERTNPTFAFIHPSNELFDYFTLLVKHYKQIVNKSSMKQVEQTLNEIVINPKSVLQRAIHRVSWKRHEEQERKLREEEELADKTTFLEIDWQDFVVVETIDFDEETVKPVVPPQLATKRSQVPLTQGDDVEADMDQSDDEQDMDVEEDDEGDVEIREDYVPKTIEPSGPAVEIVTLPDGRKVRADQVNEVMRVELLDPKWKEQLKKFQDRQATTPFESRDISKNIKRLAAARPDVFGGDESNRTNDKQQADSSSHVEKVNEAQQVESHRREMISMARKAQDGATSIIDESVLLSQSSNNENQSEPVPVPAVPIVQPTPPPVPMYQPVPPPAVVPQYQPVPPPPVTTTMPLPPEPAQNQIVSQVSGAAESTSAGTQPELKRIKASESEAVNVVATSTTENEDGPISLSVVVPVEPSDPSWKLHGQTLDIVMPSKTSTVLQLKQDVVKQLESDLPLSRFQLKSPTGFLKDKSTLEMHQLSSGTVLDIKLKTRGKK